MTSEKRYKRTKYGSQPWGHRIPDGGGLEPWRRRSPIGGSSKTSRHDREIKELKQKIKKLEDKVDKLQELVDQYEWAIGIGD
jgi:hypothetical protein